MRITLSLLLTGAALAGTTLPAGCAAPDDVVAEPVAASDHAIEIGYDDWSDPTRNAVVQVAGCTGVLIAPDVVLTAAACGWTSSAYADGNWHAIPATTIYFGPDRAAPVATATASQVSTPPPPAAGPWPDDIALLRLTAAVPATTAIPRPTYVDRPATLGASSWIYEVGYGGGRDRRVMTGQGYRDWTTPGMDILMNAFAYTATSHGDGIGDRGTNIEAGDGGGPILLGGSNGYVLGELSWWDPYGIATFGPGGEGRPALRTWIQGKAPQKPDFLVQSIGPGGCTGGGGSPMVRVTVRNLGARTASAWVDVFHGRTSAPPMGALSSIYASSGSLAPQATADLYFAIPAPAGPRRIDVLFDSPNGVPELNEANNAASATVDLADCSFS